VDEARARELVADLRAELEPVERALRGHRYLDAVERGDLSHEALAAFAAEQRLIIASDRRSFAHLAARFPEPPAGEFFLDLAHGESEALLRLEGLAASLGQTAHEPLAGCQAYSAFVCWLALNGGRADVALAFLVNLEAWGEACGRLAAALRARHDVSFFELFSAPPAGFADRALAVVEQGLAAGEDEAQARRAARLLQAYELLYWDTLAGALH
jgi:thiaminase